MGKNSVQRAIVTPTAKHYLSGSMHHNYVTIVESAEVCFEELLRTNPISNDTGPREGGTTISKLKDRLQKRYEEAYPSLAAIISYVIGQEEANALNMAPLFPHLVLPALVETHMSEVGLELPLKEPVSSSTPFHFVEESSNPVFGQLL